MIALIVIPLFVAMTVALELCARRRCLVTITQWTTIHRLHLESARRRWFSTGSWGFWSEGRSHRYFDLGVSDRTGNVRTGTAKIGGKFGGVVADVIDVRWSDEAVV